VDERLPDEGADYPIVNIVGEKVALGPVHRGFLPDEYGWTNDLATLRMQGSVPEPWPMERIVRRYQSGATAADLILFAIYERATMRPIGVTNLQEIDYRHGTAEFVIFIGAADARGKGYGTETARLMLDYAFTALGLRNVMLTVYAYNPAAHRAYEKAGFRVFGRRHACHWMGGRLWDEIYMECLASEFESPVLARVFAPAGRGA
jgi:diamine N-acetyltransferase